MPSIQNIDGKTHLHNVNYDALTEHDKLTLGFAKHNYSFLNGINSHVNFSVWISNIVSYAYQDKITSQVLAVLIATLILVFGYLISLTVLTKIRRQVKYW